MKSHVVVVGEVIGTVRIVGEGGEARFSLNNEDGSFFVKTFDPQLVQKASSLQPGDAVTVVGQLYSFVYRRCSKDHIWIKALAIIRGAPPAAESPSAVGMDVLDVMDTTQSVAGEGDLVEWIIREYAERYRHASHATSTYIYILYPAGNGGGVVEWAGTLAPITGYQLDEIASDWVQMIVPEDIAVVRNHLQSIFFRAEMVEFRVITKGGDVRWIRDHSTPVKEGETVRAYGVLQDITEYKNLEARLLQMQEMVLVGKLVEGIAYDFNNLLTVIGCHAEMLLQGVGESTVLGADANKILFAYQRAAWLTKQLLALSHRQMIQPELLDLNALVAEVGEMVRRVTRGIELVLALDPGLGYVRIDQGQAELLVADLIIYVCDSMPKGGRLTISTSRSRESLLGDASEQPQSFAVLKVISDGVKKIPLPAGESEEADANLSIVYEIARQIGATVRPASESEGAAIIVYLPQVEVSGELPGPTQTLSHPSPEEVLVVESDDMVRGIVQRVLQQAGYLVLEARRGNEALEVCARAAKPIALALIETANNADLIKSLPLTYPGVKIILSANVEPKSERHEAFLRRPFTNSELLRVVREALSAGRGRIDFHKS